MKVSEIIAALDVEIERLQKARALLSESSSKKSKSSRTTASSISGAQKARVGAAFRKGSRTRKFVQITRRKLGVNKKRGGTEDGGYNVVENPKF
jgi:hypothetical protein